jgi:hypothetical protein
MRRLIPSAFLALLLLAGVQQVQAQVDVTGTWEISWENPRGATTTTFTFAQEENAFTGTAQMMMGGRPGGGGGGGGREVEITDGKIDGNNITFSMAMGMGERSMTFTFTGTVTGDTMEGTMATGRGENPFTGKRKEG